MSKRIFRKHRRSVSQDSSIAGWLPGFRKPFREEFDDSLAPPSHPPTGHSGPRSSSAGSFASATAGTSAAREPQCHATLIRTSQTPPPARPSRPTPPRRGRSLTASDDTPPTTPPIESRTHSHTTVGRVSPEAELPQYSTQDAGLTLRPSHECIRTIRSIAAARKEHLPYLHRGAADYPSYNLSICSTHPYHLPLLEFTPAEFRVLQSEVKGERTTAAGILVSPRKLFRKKAEDIQVEMRVCVGPGDGVLECLMNVKERLKTLKQQVRNAQKGRSLEGSENVLEDRSVSVHDLQRKLGSLEQFCKDVRAFTKSAAQMREHHAQHTYFVLNERYVSGLLLSSEQGQLIHGDSFYTGDERVCGITVDTYAFDVIKNEKPGQPNADSYAAQTFNNRIFFGVADGIGWGPESRRASQSALCGLMMYFNMCGSVGEEELLNAEEHSDHSLRELNRILTVSDTHMAARCCLRAFEHAHKVVWANSDARTTLCGGIVFQLQDHDESDVEVLVDSSDEEPRTAEGRAEMEAKGRRWVFVGGTVGDSLIYRYSKETNEVMEVSRSDRSHGVRDAGGAIGGQVPDTRNLLCYCCLLDEGDLLLAVSDGVHDNLDPEVLNVSPHDLGLDHDSWRKVPDSEKVPAKNRYKEEKLADIIGLNAGSARETCSRIIKYVKDVTEEHREAYEAGGRLQRDWDKMNEADRTELNEWVQSTLKHPKGKFDHVTCMCVRVGLRSEVHSYEATPSESPAPALEKDPDLPWWAQ